MQIYDFIKPELDKLRDICNFTPDELEYFNLRAKHKSNIAISIEMNVSEAQVSKLAKRVKIKIVRALDYI
jgi:DNA-binding CsgD family transcriptional regulator